MRIAFRWTNSGPVGFLLKHFLLLSNFFKNYLLYFSLKKTPTFRLLFSYFFFKLFFQTFSVCCHDNLLIHIFIIIIIVITFIIIIVILSFSVIVFSYIIISAQHATLVYINRRGIYISTKCLFFNPTLSLLWYMPCWMK